MSDSVVVGSTPVSGVRRILLNRPERLNAFDHEMAGALAAALAEIRLDLSIRVVLLAGAGRGFCAGGDVEAMRASGDPAAYIEELSRRLHQAMHSIHRMPQPVLACVNGAVAGGGLGLALCADVRIAGASARFSAGHLKLGISPDGGPTFFLPRLLGDAFAAQILLGGEVLDAEAAYARGLVSQLVADDSLQDASLELAARIAAYPRTAVAQTKALLRQTWSRSFESQLEEERAGLGTTGRTPAFSEGIAAFLEKRPPRFV